MRKKLFISCFLFLLCCLCYAQKKASSAEQKEIIQKVEAAASSINTLQCDFVQEKHLALLKNTLVSKGSMSFMRPNCLRWEYVSPYTYTFLFNGSKVMLKSGRQKNVIDVKSSQLFQEIARIMMNSVTGKCLSDTQSFNITCYTTSSEWQARLVPLKKNLKQIFSEITLHFDVQQKMVKMVELKEKTGDSTIIRLSNVKKNCKIDEKVFRID